MNNLSICYITSRKKCHIDWFLDSLHRECGGDYSGLEIIVVDFWSQPLPDLQWTELDAMSRRAAFGIACRCPDYRMVPPMPCVWQGQHRLSKNHYFAASNSRNTGLCLATKSNIAFVDDLSVLMPGWLKAVNESIAGGYVMAGAFWKVKQLNVVDGAVISFSLHVNDKGADIGLDIREGKDDGPVECYPNWLFGCSLCAPVGAFLQINGWPMASCSMGIGGEDCLTGLALAKNGYKIKYDRRAMTLESEEDHHVDNVMLRFDKGEIGTPRDKSHALVNRWSNVNRFDNDFSGMDIRELRKRVLAGSPFPVPTQPTTDWFDSQPISEL